MFPSCKTEMLEKWTTLAGSLFLCTFHYGGSERLTRWGMVFGNDQKLRCWVRILLLNCKDYCCQNIEHWLCYTKKKSFSWLNPNNFVTKKCFHFAKSYLGQVHTHIGFRAGTGACLLPGSPSFSLPLASSKEHTQGFARCGSTKTVKANMGFSWMKAQNQSWAILI